MTIWKKTALAAGLAATALATTTPAMARDWHRNDNTAAVAIGAGIIGLAVGAIAASSSRDDRYDDRYDNGGYYGGYGSGYSSGWSYRDGYYWDRDGRRHSRDEYRRHYRDDDHRRGYNYDRGDYRRGY